MGDPMKQTDRINAYARLIEAQIGKAVRPYRKDGFVNVMNRYGTSKDTTEQYRYVAEPIIPDDTLTTYYEGNGLFAKIIDAPAEEAVKHGFELDGISDEAIEGFYKEALDELDWEEVFMTGIKWARLFGGSLGVMLINDGRGLEEPLNWKNIKSIDDIRVYDRSVIQPDYTSMFKYEPEDPFRTRGSRLGIPERYYVTSRYGNFTVHESRCLVFQNGILPENCTNSNYQIWGMPEYVRIHRALRDAELAHGSAIKMLDRSVQAVYKMKDLSAELATEEGEGKVLRRLQTIDMARGMLNSITIDSEGEDYDFRTFQFSGVSDVIDASCNFLSALTMIPQTILFGRSPAGLNATGTSDLENWYNFVDRIRKTKVRSNLRYLLSVLFSAGVSTGEIEEIPKIVINFNPLWSLSELEQADLEQKKAQTDYTKAQTAQIYTDMQALDPSEVRKKLASDSEFEIDNILSEEDLDEDFLAGMSEESLTNEEPEENASNEVSELDKETAAEGSTPTNAPAATKLPQDMTVKEKAEVESNTDKADAAEPFGVGVIVIKDGKILTGTRHNDSGYGLICGPGGHGEEGETPEQSAYRETEEEFGISPKELIPIGIGPFEPESGLRAHIFICTDFDGQPDCLDMEMVNPKFRTLEELEQLDASLFPPFKDSLEILKRELCGKRDDGGPGSGNHGHSGVPGKVGGSAPGKHISEFGATYTDRNNYRNKKKSELNARLSEDRSELQNCYKVVKTKKVLVRKFDNQIADYERAIGGVTESNVAKRIEKKEAEIQKLGKKYDEAYFSGASESKLNDIDREIDKSWSDLEKLKNLPESQKALQQLKETSMPYRKELEEAEAELNDTRIKMQSYIDDYDREIRQMNSTILRQYPDYESIETTEDASEYLKAKGYFDTKYGYDSETRLAGEPTGGRVDLTGADPDFAREVCKEYDKIFSEYPELSGNILSGITVGDTVEAGMAEYGNMFITLNKDYFASKTALAEQDEFTGYHPKVDEGKGSMSTVMHETGHAIDNYLGNKVTGDDYASTVITKKVASNLGMKVPDCKEAISKYACTNNQEFVAEAWAEYCCSSNPRPVAMEVGRVLTNMIKTGKIPGKEK